jgi:hypothetical protein
MGDEPWGEMFRIWCDCVHLKTWISAALVRVKSVEEAVNEDEESGEVIR